MTAFHFSTMRSFGIICAGRGGRAMPAYMLNRHHCFCGPMLPISAGNGKQRSIASQNLCDGWAKYRQNVCIS